MAGSAPPSFDIRRDCQLLASTLILLAAVFLSGPVSRSDAPAWALAMPLILLAGHDLARVLHQFSPPNRELPASRARFAPLFGALLFHGLAIRTAFVTPAHVSRARAGGAG